MNICLEKTCKCVSPDAPDACGCTLAAGAALIDGVLCMVCGAPLTVVSGELVGIIKQALASTPRTGIERHVVMSFGAVLAPGETREIYIDMNWTFRADKLVLDMPSQSRAQRLLACLKYAPWALFMTVCVLVQKTIDLEARRTWTWPSWRAPRPGPPVVVLTVSVGNVDQFVSNVTIPSQIFTTEALQSPYLGMRTAFPGQKLKLVVRSIAKKPYELRGSFVGTAIL